MVVRGRGTGRHAGRRINYRGKKRIPVWNTPAQLLELNWLSSATQRPAGVSTKSLTAWPRLRVGFHAVTAPVLAKRPPMPDRAAAPGPALSQPFGLLSQR